MSAVDWRTVPRGHPRTRNTREEVRRLKTRAENAKSIVFVRIDEAIWQHESFYGKYIIENTFIGPLAWRARRNGTLVKNGMVTSMDNAKAAIIDDIGRRKKQNAKAHTLGSLSPR
jgi:beta-glucanase (GH16 family)